MIPLSFAQQRLWFLDRIQQSRAYHAPVALRLQGELDVPALAAALGDLADRHETLRTVFPVYHGQPYQHVLPVGTHPELEIVSWPGDGLIDELNRVAFRPFDLAGEPQIRAFLYLLGPGDHMLLIVLHHIATDGWSLAPLLGDLATAYVARRKRLPPAWAELPVQYADYAIWERDLLGSEDDPDSRISRHLRFWSDTLAGAAEELPLPLDRPRPTARTNAAGLLPFSLDAELHWALTELAAAHGVTLFMVLHAAIAALLARLGAGDDILVGTPVAGRTDEALDTLVGFFVNMLVLRTDASGDPAFADLLARVRAGDLVAYSHQDAPFDRVVAVLNPRRSLGRNPLFQVNIVLQSNAKASPRFLDMRATPQALTSEMARFDLTVAFAENFDQVQAPAGIDANLEYARELFDDATAASMALRLTRLLRAVTADAQIRIGAIDILGPARQGSPPPCRRDGMPDHGGRAGQPATSRKARKEPSATETGCVQCATRDQRLCRLAAQVLGLGSVGADDDFFALGGDSMLAVRLVALIAEQLGAELSVRTVFDQPTVAGLSAAVAEALGHHSSAHRADRAAVTAADPADCVTGRRT